MKFYIKMIGTHEDLLYTEVIKWLLMVCPEVIGTHEGLLWSEVKVYSEAYGTYESLEWLRLMKVYTETIGTQ